MKRWVLACVVGLSLSAVAHGQEPMTKLGEVPMATAAGHSFRLPDRYGHLVGVAVSGEVHYLYFEDSVGTIRIVLAGPRSAVQRARASLDLLSTDVFIMKRGPDANGS